MKRSYSAALALTTVFGGVVLGAHTWNGDRPAAAQVQSTETEKAPAPTPEKDAGRGLFSPVADAPQVFTPRPKPVLVLDLGHRGRYTEGKCYADAGSVQGNRKGGVSEADIVDALGRGIIKRLADETRFDLVLTRQPGQDLAGGCVAWRESLLSRLKPAQAAAAKGADVTFVSLHVDESGWVGINDLSVFAAPANPASQRLAQAFAQQVRQNDKIMRTRVKPDTKNTLVLNNETQPAPAILLEFSDIRFAGELMLSGVLDNRAAVLARALQSVMTGPRPTVAP